MDPFERYPGGGRVPLGRPRNTSDSRRGYGLEVIRLSGSSLCAYCGVDLLSDYYRWLLLQVDHVVPRSVAQVHRIDKVLCEDFINLVLACSGCNGLENQYSVPIEGGGIWTIENFVNFREKVFAARFAKIAVRRSNELAFFQGISLI